MNINNPMREAVAGHPWTQRLALLLSDPLLVAINAGWATQGDLGFASPILTAVHRSLVDGGIRTLRPDDARAPCSTTQIFDDEDRHTLALLSQCEPAGAADRAPSLPSCARFFVACATELYGREPGQSNPALIRIMLQLSALSLAALDHALPAMAAPLDAKLALFYRNLAAPDGPESRAINALLALQSEFLADLFKLVRLHRLERPIERIQARRSLENAAEPAIALYPGVGEIMFTEQDDTRDIAFTVERYPCTAEVLDPRVVRIPPGKSNNRHVHAHETLFMFLSGAGEILVGETWVEVKGGDAVFAPRWAVHQTRNTGAEELVLLAITDYYLTSQVYVGKYDKI